MWKQYDKIDSRKSLNIPLNKKVLLFISEKIDNPIKGFDTIKKFLKNKGNEDFYLNYFRK